MEAKIRTVEFTKVGEQEHVAKVKDISSVQVDQAALSSFASEKGLWDLYLEPCDWNLPN